MEHADIISKWDKHYIENPVVCPKEGTGFKLMQSGVTGTWHGNMVVHGSGAFLLCGLCETKVPIARI